MERKAGGDGRKIGGTCDKEVGPFEEYLVERWEQQAFINKEEKLGWQQDSMHWE